MEPTQILDETYHEDGASQDAATSSDRPVSPGATRTGSYQTHGHHYEAFTIQDHARVHTGDVHSSQHTHYHGAPRSHPHAKETSLLDALAFEQMDFRSATIAPAYAKTCDWLFSAAAYQRWRNQDLVSEHNGFLWIKGKPGAGKSTLIKHAWEHAKVTYEPEKTVSFFFNARGAALGKSVEGMYRCLLHQMVDQMPQLERKVSNADRSAYRSTGWPIAVLQDLLCQAVLHLSQQTRMNCYIDALDEGDDEEQVREMVEFFYEVAERAVSNSLPFSVCLASRYYPKISLSSFEELRLEDYGGHDADISEYVSNKLRIGSRQLKQELASVINLRSRGVFLWVVLVVAVLNRENDRGNQHLLLTRLQEIPDGLLHLFDDLRSRNPFDNRFLPAIQWVLYALRPLRPEELYIAILTSLGELTAERLAWIRQTINVEMVDDFVLSSSKGLLEVSCEETWEAGMPWVLGRTARRVQFIHETVREYFLGAPEFANQPAEMLCAQTHTNATRTSNPCVKESMSSPRRKLFSAPGPSRFHVPLDRLANKPNSCEALMFKSQDHGTQSQLAVDGDGHDGWTRVFQPTEPVTPQARPGHSTELDPKSVDDVAAISHARLSHICQSYIRISHASDLCSGSHPLYDDFLNTNIDQRLFLNYALEMAFGHADAASQNGWQMTNLAQNFPWDKWLFCNTIMNGILTKDYYRHMQTWLQVVTHRNYPHLVRDELSSINAEAERSRQGKQKLHSLLDACVEGLGSALHIAASRPYSTKILKLLLESGANVNNVCKGVGSPLHQAVHQTSAVGFPRVDPDAASILLEHGADVNAKDDHGNSALHYAIINEHPGLTRILERYGADLNGRIGVHGNAAQTAARLKDRDLLRVLSSLSQNADESNFLLGGAYDTGLPRALFVALTEGQ